MKNRTIKVDYLARVEGEGGLYIKIKGDEVVDVKLKIFEPPRFFEAFLRGRHHTEVPDITARICGICPIAYQMSAVHAMENALQIKVDGALRELRRLLYCGEWIESHTLHVYMLHAPDFLGYDDAIKMAKDYPDIVKQGLKIKKIGNEIVTLLGGREIHPINVRVGGFYRVPHPRELQHLKENLKWARDAVQETVRWVSTFYFPDFQPQYEFVSLQHAAEYPFNEGNLVSNLGLNIAAGEFEDHFQEEHVAHSNALHCRHKERGAYFVGPLARYNLNFDKLPAIVKEMAKEVGLSAVCNNPFQSIIIRSLELLFACDEAIRVIENYEMPSRPFIDYEVRAASGAAATEAPRGMLYHHYGIDDDGLITTARIVPPTSQNQKRMEEDLWLFAKDNIHTAEKAFTLQCEQAIRNYDPCISCATHFLKLKIERE